MKKKGFTLIELMVVITIIGLLAAIAIPRFAGVTDSAKIANVQGNLSSLRTSIEMYNVKNGMYPKLVGATNLEDVKDTTAATATPFSELYGKSVMPTTPGYGSPEIKEVNTVIEAANATGNALYNSTSAGTGGWSYRATDGAIRAFIKDGAYGDTTENNWSNF